MVAMGWLYLAATSCLLSASCLGAAVNGEDAVGVSMCCPEGRVLKMVQNTARRLGGWRKERGDEYVPKCVRSRRTPKDTLDGAAIIVTGDEGGQKEMVVKKTGVMLPSCSLGLKFQMISLQNSDSDESTGNGDGQPEDFRRVKLGDYDCGQSNCPKGNVYVDDKPVCDDDWDDDDAIVVCKELGFPEGGYATKESYFGKVDLEKQSGFDQVRCSGLESSLLDCRHEAFDDCGDSEGAGVVCFSSQDYNNYGNSGEPEPVNAAPIPLTSSGQLSMPNTREGLPPTTYKAGEFCMAGVFEGGEVEMKEGEALAVMCEPCISEVLCSVMFLDLFGAMTEMSNEIVAVRERDDLTNNIVRVGDKDADAKVNFEEFKAKIDGYVEKVFNLLDSDGDGSLDEGVSIKSWSAKFFLEALDEVFLFFDLNEDDILSLEDAPGHFRDRNNDGKITLREVLGFSLINLPAPLFRLYATLDKDKNEKISIEEATSFIKGTFFVVDQDEDCSTNLDELIATLNESKLPKEYQLAIRLIGDHYLTLGDFFLNQIVSAADVDGNKKATLAELIGLKDPAVLFAIQNVAESMGEANMGTISFIRGHMRGSNPDDWQAVNEIWYNVLYDFVENRKYDSVPTNFCGLE